jgi:hypothetical protein
MMCAQARRNESSAVISARRAARLDRVGHIRRINFPETEATREQRAARDREGF